MRIAFFHNLPEGGAKRVVFEQVKYLSEKHEIDVFEINKTDNKFNDLREIVNVKAFEFSLHNNLPSFLNRLYSDYKNFYSLKVLHKRIAKEINNGNYDLVIVHPDRYIQSPFLFRYLKVPSIYFCEEVLRIAYEKELAFNEKVVFLKKWYERFTRKIRKQIDRKNAILATKILANSAFTSENIKKAYGRESSIFLLGVDSNLFKPQKREKDIDVLFIGEKEDMEGYSLLDKIIKDNFIKVKILSRKNKTFGYTDSDLNREYNRSKIVVALNRNEPFGLIPLEAMSCGVPVIAVNEGGFKETVKNNVTGYLIKRDRNELKSKVERLLKDIKSYTQMSENCRKYIIHDWDWNIRMKDFEKYLKTE